MDPLWLFIALLCGFFARQIMLPPMVGFLAAGFVLHGIGVESSSSLQTMADLGVTLLLFTIGLKLRLRNLLAPEVWAAGSLHMLLITSLGAGLLVLAAVSGLVWFEQMDWRSASVVAFALSFSSTVFAVKIFEDRGEMKTRHGQISIGILIIQDIIAVVFLTLATGKIPSMWAFLLLALPFARPFLNKLLQRSGHGEVLILFGLFMAIGGGQLFQLVGMKADLGALVFGILLSNQGKTNELARSLLSFKDIFLVGFFLSIGLSGIPTFSDVAIAVMIVAFFLPIKSLLYFGLLAVFKLRARTAFLSANGLSNYSEFGLIVAAVGVSSGWITQQWLMIIAVALSLSFVAAAVVNGQVHTLYARYEKYFHRFESTKRLPKDLPADLGDAEILILGMGRVGRGAYTSMHEVFGEKVYGIDADVDQVARYKKQNLRVQVGDAEDVDFWHGVNVSKLHLVMLAMPALGDMRQAVKLIKAEGYTGFIAAVTRYEDDRKILESEGVDATFNFYTEAGTGFAEHVRQQLKGSGKCLTKN
ncbi:Putative glutathione-regulated potassium-efflux system protein KefB [hydrothermal vent metagenome]|uniref:Glutathione-regulated potassium-efflux system protein KefB n=1 Tax=hydrothermal vent metagenome TaxID=652676 RepID=A0A3B0WXM8_9ZZZZ